MVEVANANSRDPCNMQTKQAQLINNNDIPLLYVGAYNGNFTGDPDDDKTFCTTSKVC